MLSFQRVSVLAAVGIAFIGVSSAQDFGLEQGDLRAQLTPRKHTTLGAAMTGQIDELAVREGRSFESGATLVRFDCSLQQAQLEKANAQMAEARNIYEGNKQMADHNAIGAVELENSRIAIDKAKADLNYLKAMISRCTIKAPYAGSVGRQLVREKEIVQSGQPLLEIMDSDVLELEFLVPSKWLSWLKPGYQFQVTIEDTGRDYPVKLEFTSAKVDPMSQTVRAVAVVGGKFDELLPGMSGRLTLKPPHGATP
jgi:membrane fusion protein (multidrug efflux system)